MKSAFPYSSLYRWYEFHHRELPWRETTNPYYIYLSEVILQQTRVQQGMEYYHRFVSTFPTVYALAHADEDQVLRLWQGLGYYSRARNLHKAAQMIVGDAATADEVLFPDTMEALKQLPGVGDYTAGAIAAFAYNLPYPALDGNVYRVLARYADCDIAFDTTGGKKHFHQLAEQLLDRENARLFDSAIMELGAIHCVPVHPDCVHCPLTESCQAYAHHTVELLPVRKPRIKPIDRDLHYLFYITPARETLIHRRGEGDIWAHLYELIPTDLLPSSEYPLAQPSAQYTHVLSHQKIHATFHIVAVDELPQVDGAIRVRLDELDDYGFSRLTIRFFDDMLPLFA